ncbi:hypothetical protein CCAX7_19030 [Capsulimonas corticalis]|uniref:Uncharacterized protein n=2 Tax=Capsulimonas corticalis TaxID=2219043 RepID=A0A9N7L2I9_9BACT|nr:hypothetical protein CCAX7_19030 [Capsulimonas corticalis]
MMACVGGWICGAGAGAATFYCYGIGGWLGLPLGMVGGAFLGAKTPARRATLTFTTGAYTAWALYHAAQRLNWDNILVAALSLIGASLAMLVVYALERLLPERVSFWAAVTSAVIFSIWMMVDFAHWLTTTQ